MNTPGRRARRGFTLVETIAAMTIIGFMAGLGSVLVWQGVAACRGTQVGPQTRAELSLAGERIVRELRTIGLRPGSGAPAPDIDEVAASAVEFNAGDRIEQRGDELVLIEDAGEARVLLRGVSGVAVKAYGEDGELALPLVGSACDDVRRLTLSIEVSRDGVSDTLRVGTFVRVMMTGVGP